MEKKLENKSHHAGHRLCHYVVDIVKQLKEIIYCDSYIIFTLWKIDSILQ